MFVELLLLRVLIVEMLRFATVVGTGCRLLGASWRLLPSSQYSYVLILRQDCSILSRMGWFKDLGIFLVQVSETPNQAYLYL